MNIFRTVTLKLRFFIVILILVSTVGILTVSAEDTFDDSITVARSNVMSSQVDPSFWNERESLSIGKVETRILLPTSNSQNPVLQQDSIVIKPSGEQLTLDELGVITRSQEVALILVNNPYYQAGESVFKLTDKQQIKLSSVKYAATREYYGRTDVASSWVTDFYNAAYSDDYQNLLRLLKELPAEV